MWPPSFEKRRILNGKISEYIDTVINNNREKPDLSPPTIKGIRMETSPIGSLKNGSVSTESFYNSLAAEKRSKNFSTSDPDPKDYRRKFPKDDSIENKTKPILETVDWYVTLKPLKNVNKDKEIRKSEKYYWNNLKTDSNKRIENRKGSGKSNDSRNQRLFKALTERGETNIPFQYKPISVESIGKVSEENTETPTSRMESSKVFVNSFPQATTSIINLSPELLTFNRSYLESSSNKTSNSSIALHLPPSPNSKLSKSAVAAIVAAINGIIGFTGAAIFTSTKFNYVLVEKDDYSSGKYFFSVVRVCAIFLVFTTMTCWIK